MRRMSTVDVTLKSGDNKLCMPRYCFEHVLTCIGIKSQSRGVIDPKDVISGVAKVNRAINLNYGCEFTCDESVVMVDKQEVNCPKISLNDLKMSLNEIKQFASKSKTTIVW